MENIVFQLPTNRVKPELPSLRKKESANDKAASPFNRMLDHSLSAQQSLGVSDEEQADDENLSGKQDSNTNQGGLDNLIFSLAAVSPTVIPANAQQIPNQPNAPMVKAQIAGVLLNTANQAVGMPISISLHQQTAANIQLGMAASESVQTLANPLTPDAGKSVINADGQTQLPAQVPIQPVGLNQQAQPKQLEHQKTATTNLFQPELQSKIDVSTAANPALINQVAQSLPDGLSNRSQIVPEASQPSSDDTLQVSDLQSELPTFLPGEELIPEAVLASKEKQLVPPVLGATKLSLDNQPVTPLAKREQIVVGQSKGTELSIVVPAQAQSVGKQQLPEESDFLSQDTFSPNFGLTELPAGKPDVAAFDTTPQITAPNQHDIIKQIVDHARVYLRPGNQSEMILQLQPEHLGELTLKVTVGNGVVNAAFHSENPEVRQVIEASLPQLRQDLSQQGIKLDTVSVFSGSEQFFDNRQRPTQQQQFTPIRKNRREFLQAIESSEESQVNITDGVDYRI